MPVGHAAAREFVDDDLSGILRFLLVIERAPLYPFVNIHNDPDPAYQLRRYAWNAKLPLSILTNFEEFAVYDCRVRPDHTDKASAARMLYVTFDEYPARWDEIAGIFAKEAVDKGS